MVVVVGMVGVVPMVLVRMGPSLEGEPNELGFAFEPERGVDDEPSDIVKTAVNCQYITRVWVLWDRSGEDVRSEFRRKVREGRHGEILGRVSLCLERWKFADRRRDGGNSQTNNLGAASPFSHQQRVLWLGVGAVHPRLGLTRKEPSERTPFHRRRDSHPSNHRLGDDVLTYGFHHTDGHHCAATSSPGGMYHM